MDTSPQQSDALKIEPKLPGANCMNCPLKCGTVVPPERKTNPKFVIVGEGPWKNEAQEGRPFVGVSGILLNKALDKVGIKREHAHVTNAVACFGGRELSPGEWKEALAACRPRLQKELDEHQGMKILALGAKALSSIEGRKLPIGAWFGYPINEEVFPILHPAAVLRNRLFKEVFVKSFHRAAKWLRGELKWEWPPLHIECNDESLAALQRMRGSKVLGVDVETGGKSPIFAPLLCLSVADDKEAVSLRWPIESEAHREAFADLLAGSAVKVFHNAQHDLLCLETNGLPVAPPVDDTLLLHVASFPGMPHNLSFACAQHFAAPRWKSEFHDESELKGLEVFTKSSPVALRTYNAKDSYMGAGLRSPLRGRVEADPRLHKIVENLSALSAIAIDMRRRGVKVDLEAREVHRAELSASIAETARVFAEEFPEWKIGKTGTHPSLKKLFFERFGLRPLRRSDKTGKPKLDTWSLQMFRAHGGDVSRAAETILRHRKATKLLTTYVEGIEVNPDGCVHPAWSVWGPITGRWACAEPNLMNIPKAKELDFGTYKVKLPGMRDLIVARPGHVFVAADYEKLELWIVAALSGDQPLISAWRSKVDVHRQNAADMFQLRPDLIDDNQRHFAKRFVYGANYDAKAETLWAAMVTEFPATKLPHVRKLLMAWKSKHPSIFRMHGEWRRFVYENGYIEIPHSGLRVLWPDEKQTVNVPVQGTAAVLANRAARTIAERGFAHWLAVQCHDELMLEVPEDRVHEAKALLQEAMEQPLELNGREWVFPVEVKAGKNWGTLKKL